MAGGEIDRWEAPGEGARGWCAPRAAWPVETLRTTLRFVQGEAVALDGNEMPAHELLARLTMLLARDGVGCGLSTGESTVSPHGRTLYRAPGCTVLHAAYGTMRDAVAGQPTTRDQPAT